MSKDSLRVSIFALAFLGLAVASVFCLDWFFDQDFYGRQITIDLRHVTRCGEGRCDSLALGDVPTSSMYSRGAWTTFWGTVLVALLVGVQAFNRVTTGIVNRWLGQMTIFACLLMLATVAATGYLFPPWEGQLERTIAPFLLLLAHVAGIFAAYDAAHDVIEDYYRGGHSQVVVDKPATPRQDWGPELDLQYAAPSTTPPRSVPPHLARRVRFAVQTAELMRGGVDAHREDGAAVIVMWRDVVGVIARRLPPELDGETFVDVVSTAGSPLRVLSWTQLTGERLLGEGDDRARSFAAFVAAQCPEARIDPATRAFIEQGTAAEQFASADDLDVYDTRLG